MPERDHEATPPLPPDLQEALRRDVDHWIKKRYSIFGLLVAAIGFFGVGTIVNSLYSSEIEDLRSEVKDYAHEEIETAKDILRYQRSVVESMMTLWHDQVTTATHELNRVQIEHEYRLAQLQEAQKVAEERLNDINSVHKAVGESGGQIDNIFRSVDLTKTYLETFSGMQIQINQTLRSQMRLISETIDLVRTQTGDPRKVERNLNEVRALLEEIAQTMTAFANRDDFKVILYRRKNDDRAAVAEQAREVLADLGFHAEPWRTSATGASDAMVELSEEFRTDLATCGSGGATLVHHPHARHVAKEIADALRERIEYFKTAEAHQALVRPQPHHLKLFDDSVAETERLLVLCMIN